MNTHAASVFLPSALAAAIAAGCGAGPEAGSPEVRAASVPSWSVPSPGAPASPGETPPCPLDWRVSLDSGLAARDEGRLDEARERLLCAVRLRPSNAAAAAALADVEARLCEATVREAATLFDEGRTRAACERLVRSATFETEPPGATEAVRLLRRFGYAPYGSTWLHSDDVIVRERRAARDASKRRAELGLGEKFALDRYEDIRIFSDSGTTEAAIFARFCRGMLVDLRGDYSRLFAPLGLRGEGGGIDVVAFRRRQDYEDRTGSRTTVGMFLPKYRASFFFTGERSPEDLASDLVHEVCHQLDDRILGMRYPPPWLQEGLAVCFEGALVSGEERDPFPLALPPLAASRIRDALQSPERWWGVRRIIGTPQLDHLHGTDAVHDFYTQAAFLVSYLLDDRERSRELFYRTVERARAPDARPESAWRDFEAALAETKTDLVALDADLRRAAEARYP